jgi:hypothetical protein
LAAVIRSLGLSFLIVSVAAAAEPACSSSNGFSLGEHPVKPSLGIQLFGINVRPEFPLRVMEHLRIYLAESFRTALSGSGYFGAVSLLAEDSDAKPDFTMVGTFTHASIGTSGRSLYSILTQRTFEQSSSVNVVGGILKAGTTEPVSTFECQVACCITSQYGLPTPPHSGVEKSEISIAAMAKALKTAYLRMEKNRTHQK